MSALGIVIAKLKATAGVTTLVAVAKIYPVVLPQAVAAPAIVCNIVGGRDDQMLDGAARFYEHRVSVECLAATGSAVVAIGDAVMAALENANGTFDGSVASIYFSDLDLTDFADDRSLARRILHFRVRWRPPA